LKDNVNIYDEKGHRVGTMKQDVLFQNRTNIYDRSGKKTGVLKTAPLSEDRAIRNSSEFALAPGSGERPRDAYPAEIIGILKPCSNRRGECIQWKLKEADQCDPFPLPRGSNR
jgi:hypothetical protein